MKTIVIPVYGEQHLGKPFEGRPDVNVLQHRVWKKGQPELAPNEPAVLFEEFSDGELRTQLPVGLIQGATVVLLAEPGSARSILQLRDIAQSAASYGAAMIVIGVTAGSYCDPEESIADELRLWDRFLSYLLGKIPLFYGGNLFFVLDHTQRIMVVQQCAPNPDPPDAQRSRAKACELVSSVYGAEVISRQSSQDHWVCTPMTGLGLPVRAYSEGRNVRSGRPVLVTLGQSKYLGECFSRCEDFDLVPVQYSAYGSLSLATVPKSVRGRKILIAGSTYDDASYFELSCLICSAVERGAHEVWVAIPYFGCARMDRAVREGDVVTAASRAKLLSNLPTAGRGVHFLIGDVHSNAVLPAFDKPVSHVYFEPALLVGIDSALNGRRLEVVASPDHGHAKWTMQFSRQYGLAAVVLDKNRVDGDTVESSVIVSGSAAHIRGKSCMLHDDMSCTGGTHLLAGEVLRDCQPSLLFLALSHGVFAPGAVEKLIGVGGERIFDFVVLANSHPNAVAAAVHYPWFFKLVNVAPVFSEAFIKGITRA